MSVFFSKKVNVTIWFLVAVIVCLYHVQVLKDRRRGAIGVKRMGELDKQPFHEFFQRSSSKKYDEEYIAAKLWTEWVEHLKDPQWHPFKILIQDMKVSNSIFFCFPLAFIEIIDSASWPLALMKGSNNSTCIFTLTLVIIIHHGVLLKQEKKINFLV